MFLKITEDRIDETGLPQSVLVPMFTSNTVIVLREEEAYSFLSLVADCGGVLGLFIGFNFLLFWDSMIWILKRIQIKLSGTGAMLKLNHDGIGNFKS